MEGRSRFGPRLDHCAAEYVFIISRCWYCVGVEGNTVEYVTIATICFEYAYAQHSKDVCAWSNHSVKEGRGKYDALVQATADRTHWLLSQQFQHQTVSNIGQRNFSIALLSPASPVARCWRPSGSSTGQLSSLSPHSCLGTPHNVLLSSLHHSKSASQKRKKEQLGLYIRSEDGFVTLVLPIPLFRIPFSFRPPEVFRP